MAGERLVLPRHISKNLFRSSFLTVFSVASGAYNERYDCMAAAITVLTTSINYWRHPVFGIRRNVDIVAAAGCLSYQLVFVAPEAPDGACMLYLGSVGGGLGCYAMARLSNFVRANQRISCMWHMGLHTCANVGNLVLYDSLGHNHLDWE
jgi:hypothetical protein